MALKNISKQESINEGLRKAREQQKPFESWSLERIAEAAGCTRERIRQIEREALFKVRRATIAIQKELRKAGGVGYLEDKKGENYGVD